MIRVPEVQNMQLNVIMADGTKYLNADVPPAPFDMDGCVAFWDGDKLRAVPFAQTQAVWMTFGDEKA